MKATLRKNGYKMFTFRVKYYISNVELERAVMNNMNTDGTVFEYRDATHNLPISVTRMEILAAMRTQLDRDGPWNCGAWDEVTDAMQSRATSIVEAAFPELYEKGKTG